MTTTRLCAAHMQDETSGGPGFDPVPPSHFAIASAKGTMSPCAEPDEKTLPAANGDAVMPPFADQVDAVTIQCVVVPASSPQERSQPKTPRKSGMESVAVLAVAPTYPP